MGSIVGSGFECIVMCFFFGWFDVGIGYWVYCYVGVGNGFGYVLYFGIDGYCYVL